MTGRIPLKKQQSDDESNGVSNQENNQSMGNVKNKLIISNKRKIDNKDIDNTTTTPSNGFLRIQLGDQTDSKMLLGQYHCTDVPGEFIWLPGVLTQVCV